MSRQVCSALFGAAVAFSAPYTAVPVWPLPENFECHGQDDKDLFNSNVTVTFAQHVPSPVAAAALQRYQGLLRAAGSDNGRVRIVNVDVATSDETLSLSTDYSHSIELVSALATSTCPKSHPWAYRPLHNFDYCCATGDDCNGNIGVNSLSTRRSRSECCKDGANIRCSSPPCADNNGGEEGVVVATSSPYGLVHSMETLLQLADLSCTSFRLSDRPAFAYRGLMLDVSRRFYPIALLQNTLEGMAMMKMNVLHLHFGEQCWRIESKLFPALHTRDCSAVTYDGNHTYHNNEYYTQEDIRHLVRFAQLRGIRVIPEVDSPGHATALCNGLAHLGLQCCPSRKGGQTIANDPNGTSVAIVSEVIREVSSLFPDNVFHIGSDEIGNCEGFDSTRGYEEKIINFVQELGKIVIGWDDFLSHTKAAEAFPSVLVEEWGQHEYWQKSARLGYQTVAARAKDFYLDYAKFHPDQMWKDLYISTDGGDGHINANASERALLLGGETAMWSDLYVPPRRSQTECMFQSPDFDTAFSASTSSMIWPRAAVAAGSFYRFDAQLRNTSDVFASLLRNLSRRLAARGIEVCECTVPSHQGCTQQSHCGVNYCPKAFREAPWHHDVSLYIA